ncbi:MAG TPA: transporter substrate-binding domain-containing protein [Nocardioidaceae bacterium]|jgi:polar amino acid transport system substrate-binding protein
MRKKLTFVSLLALLVLPLAACGGDDSGDNDSSAPPAGSGVCGSNKTTDDLLAEICDKGVITVSTDPKYPPQSSLNEQTGKYEGFDIDVATEIANRLGVKVAWQTPAWEAITAGSWNGRWDMSVGSMTPTNDRQKVLDFSQPYYFTPAVVVVHKDNTSVQDIATDLDGKKIGVCSACTYEQFLKKTLAIKGFTFDFVIDDAEAVGYDTDTSALNDLALGDGVRLDAVITSLTTAQGFIDSGKPVKIVGDPVFYEPLAVAIDKSAPKDPSSLAAAVDKIVGEMHADGTLTTMSKKWYDGTDLTVTQ